MLPGSSLLSTRHALEPIGAAIRALDRTGTATCKGDVGSQDKIRKNKIRKKLSLLRSTSFTSDQILSAKTGMALAFEPWGPDQMYRRGPGVV